MWVRAQETAATRNRKTILRSSTQ